MNKPCKLWAGYIDRYGYGQVGFSLQHYGTRKISRIVWIRKHGSIPKGMQVLHRCDNRACYEETHLFLGTPQDNMTDKRLKGRCRQGPTKLSREQRREIWNTTREYVPGMLSKLGREYGVHPSTIARIRDGVYSH